jgi:hypothetical protein
MWLTPGRCPCVKLSDTALAQRMVGANSLHASAPNERRAGTSLSAEASRALPTWGRVHYR